MSRIGNLPIQVPAGVTVKIEDRDIAVTGSKGTLSYKLPKPLKITNNDGSLVISRDNDEKVVKSLHGLSRALIANMIQGVNEGYTRRLEVNGVGFKINLNGRKLVMSLGFSHDIEFELPEGVEGVVDGNTITISGADKQLVGQTAAEIRSKKPPEPYKGKGIKYDDEQIIKKAGKSAAAAGEKA